MWMQHFSWFGPNRSAWLRTLDERVAPELRAWTQALVCTWFQCWPCVFPRDFLKIERLKVTRALLSGECPRSHMVEALVQSDQLNLIKSSLSARNIWLVGRVTIRATMVIVSIEHNGYRVLRNASRQGPWKINERPNWRDQDQGYLGKFWKPRNARKRS